MDVSQMRGPTANIEPCVVSLATAYEKNPFKRLVETFLLVNHRAKSTGLFPKRRKSNTVSSTRDSHLHFESNMLMS